MPPLNDSNEQQINKMLRWTSKWVGMSVGEKKARWRKSRSHSNRTWHKLAIRSGILACRAWLLITQNYKREHRRVRMWNKILCLYKRKSDKPQMASPYSTGIIHSSSLSPHFKSYICLFLFSLLCLSAFHRAVAAAIQQTYNKKMYLKKIWMPSMCEQTLPKKIYVFTPHDKKKQKMKWNEKAKAHNVCFEKVVRCYDVCIYYN